MTPPLTNFEAVGDWTTREQEEIFLNQIASETDIQIIQHGTTTQGRPIRRIELGSGPAVMIVCLLHGNEPASREACLAQIRDYAYTTDPDILGYLAAHRVVWIPTSNPDSLLIRRQTSTGVDPNRDFFAVTQPESRAMIDALHQVQPNLLVDAHEYFYSAGDDWWGAPSTHPAIHPTISAVEDSLFQHGLGMVRDAGYTANKYPDSERGRATLAVYGSTAMHTPQLLSETNASVGDITVRVPVQRIILDMVVQWHSQNSDACTAAQQASRQHAMTSTAADKLSIRELYLGSDTPELVRLEGYQLHEPVPQRLADTHRLVITEDNFAPMNQLGRAILPQIFDPDSIGVEVQASRVLRTTPEPLPPRQPLPKRPLQGLRVRINGRTRDVTGMRVRINGRTRDVRMDALPAE